MRVLERPMRRDHKGHPGVSRQAAKNVHIGLQPPGRTAQTHHAKIITCGACIHSFPLKLEDLSMDSISFGNAAR